MLIVAGFKIKRRPILRHRRIIGEAIRTYRKRVGMTQEKLAEPADLNPKYLGKSSGVRKSFQSRRCYESPRPPRCQFGCFFVIYDCIYWVGPERPIRKTTPRVDSGVIAGHIAVIVKLFLTGL